MTVNILWHVFIVLWIGLQCVIVVIYVTHCHTNDKMIVYTRIDVEYSLSPLNFNIMLIYFVERFHIVFHAKFQNENSPTLFNVLFGVIILNS